MCFSDGDPPPGNAGPVALLPAEGGPIPPSAGTGGGPGLLDEFLYPLYGMYLALLAARMAASQGDQPGHGDSLFPDQLRPRPRGPYPWDDFVGPLPGDIASHGSGRGPCQAGGGPRTSSKTWSGGPGASLDAGAGGSLLG